MPEIKMPKLSDTMTEGTLVSWKKQKGDKVTSGEIIAEIETDKATMEWEATDDGILSEIFVLEGGKVSVGESVALILAPRREGPRARRCCQTLRTSHTKSTSGSRGTRTQARSRASLTTACSACSARISRRPCQGFTTGEKSCRGKGRQSFAHHGQRTRFAHH